MERIEQLKRKIAKEEEKRQLLEMAIGAVGINDPAWAGAQLANRRKHKQYLRSRHLGKFRKGKRK